MEHASPETGGGRVRAADVERIRQTVVMFRKLDRAQGGGDLRDTVVNHLHGVARTKLSGSYGDDVGRSLFRAVAELTELAGWLSFDSGRHALAQRYHIQALRLAQAADDRAYGAYVMANMACQAVYLGHGWEAVQLARAAYQGARGSLTHRGQALVLAMEARGHAALREERGCVDALRAAERALDAADGDEDPAWCQYFDKAELVHEFAHCHRDLRQPERTQQFANEAIGLRADGYTRRCAPGHHLHGRRAPGGERTGRGVHQGGGGARHRDAAQLVPVQRLPADLPGEPAAVPRRSAWCASSASATEDMYVGMAV
ncbi:hypothetical protein ACU686_22640 [Yinghuangia aomiensis]